jgi:hypothetical protein
MVVVVEKRVERIVKRKDLCGVFLEEKVNAIVLNINYFFAVESQKITSLMNDFRPQRA